MTKRLWLVVLCLVMLFTQGCKTQKIDENQVVFKSKIISIDEKHIAQDEKTYPVQDIQIEVLEGKYEGQTFITQSFIDVSNYKNFKMYGVGDRVNVEITVDETSGTQYVSVNSLIRVQYLGLLSLLFLLTIVIIAGIKGFKTIVALILTVASIVFVIVPFISKGYDPIIVSLICGVGITIFTLVLVGGVNIKTASAVIGTLCGLMCATLLTFIASGLLRVTGISTEAVGMIMISELGYQIDIRGIFTAGIIIGCLGAVMDVGMSISSSVSEICAVSEKTSQKALFKSGMSVGRDIMGTMANTLILAYTGGTIMQMVVWKIYGISFIDMLNREYIAAEVVKALCGSFGMVLTIPITCVVASRLIGKKTAMISEG
jgi:uncharacterized membrane protein